MAKSLYDFEWKGKDLWDYISGNVNLGNNTMSGKPFYFTYWESVYGKGAEKYVDDMGYDTINPNNYLTLEEQYEIIKGNLPIKNKQGKYIPLVVPSHIKGNNNATNVYKLNQMRTALSLVLHGRTNKPLPQTKPLPPTQDGVINTKTEWDKYDQERLAKEKKDVIEGDKSLASKIFGYVVGGGVTAGVIYTIGKYINERIKQNKNPFYVSTGEIAQIISNDIDDIAMKLSGKSLTERSSISNIMGNQDNFDYVMNVLTRDNTRAEKIVDLWGKFNVNIKDAHNFLLGLESDKDISPYIKYSNELADPRFYSKLSNSTVFSTIDINELKTYDKSILQMSSQELIDTVRKEFSINQTQTSQSQTPTKPKLILRINVDNYKFGDAQLYGELERILGSRDLQNLGDIGEIVYKGELKDKPIRAFAEKHNIKLTKGNTYDRIVNQKGTSSDYNEWRPGVVIDIYNPERSSGDTFIATGYGDSSDDFDLQITNR